MSFTHDCIDLPPLAWVTLFKKRYSHLFGGYLPSAIRRWGYVIWDAHRLNSGAKQYLSAEIQAMYGSEALYGSIDDPRDGGQDQ